MAVLSEGSREISVFSGDGTGGFTRTFQTSVGPGATGLTAAAVDGDGTLDLLVGNEHGDLLILLGNGDGTLQSYRRAGQSMALAVADLDRDGRNDLLVGNESLDRLSVVREGVGPQVVGDREDGLLAPAAVTSEDLNRDGIADLVVSNQGGTTSWCTRAWGTVSTRRRSPSRPERARPESPCRT